MSRSNFIFFILSMLFVGLLHVFSHLIPFNYSWGFNFLTFFPLIISYIILILMILLFIPAINNRLQSAISFLFDLKIPFFILPLIAFAIFYSAMVVTHFLGDGYLWLRIIPESYPLYASEILNLFLHHNLHLLVNKAFQSDALVVYRLTSMVTGLFFIYLLFKVSKIIVAEKAQQPIFVLTTITSGFILIFFGYVEHYAVIFVTTLLYIYLSIKHLDHKIKPLIPSLALGVSLSFHLMTILLYPAHIYQNIKKYSWRSFQFWFHTSLPIAIYLSIFTLIIIFNDQSSFEIIRTYKLLPLSTIFSLEHLVNSINLYLLIGPLGLILLLGSLIFLFKKIDWQDPILIFLLLISSVFLAYTLIFDADKGQARDWDLFSISGLVFLLPSVYILTKYESNKRLMYLTVIISTIALVHTVPWILVNRDYDKSINRFQMLMAVNSEKSGSAHEELAIYYREHKFYEKAEAEFKTALNIVPANARYWSQLAHLYVLTGKFNEAIAAYKKSLVLNPENPKDHINLGNAYRDQHKFNQALIEFRKAAELKPDLWPAYFNQALVLTDMGQLDSAILAYKDCLALNPVQAEAHYNLATIYGLQGNFEAAIKYFTQAVKLKPDWAVLHYNLGSSLYKCSRHREAVEEYKIALKLNPNSPETHNNIGLAYEALDQVNLAEMHYREALRLKPDLTNASHNLQRIKKKSKN